MTLKFNEWSSLNEAGIFDKIKNWLSGTFGGSIDSLDKLANEYRSAELEYVEKWEDINVEIDKLDLERSQTKSDPAEIKRIENELGDKLAALDKFFSERYSYSDDDLSAIGIIGIIGTKLLIPNKKFDIDIRLTSRNPTGHQSSPNPTLSRIGLYFIPNTLNSIDIQCIVRLFQNLTTCSYG
jgi:hypothetical protein